ncbi:MAG: hypothetical protein WBM54_05650 [Woeseia sp.]
MLKKTFLALTLAALSFAAHADMRTVTEAFEVGLNDFRAPGADNGTLAMRPCSDCDFETLRVTSQTRYSINGEALTLSDFRQALQTARSKSESIVIVSHSVDSDTVKAVSASIK